MPFPYLLALILSLSLSTIACSDQPTRGSDPDVGADAEWEPPGPCTGTTCLHQCPDGGCDFTCEPGFTCRIACNAGGCNTTCDEAKCTIACREGNCQTTCQGGTCDIYCDGGDCTNTCTDNATCTVTADPGTKNKLTCTDAKSCTQSCTGNCDQTCQNTTPCTQQCTGPKCKCDGCDR